MKAEMDRYGVITIIAENGAEAYALKAWSKIASVDVEDLARNEKVYFRSSRLVVDASFSGEVLP